MTRRRLALAFASAVLVIGLAGCATPTLDGATGSDLQRSVVEVAELAAAGDAAAAIAQLDDLQTDLDAAIATDLITAARAARIQTAIDAVRIDLETLLAPTPEPTATPEQTVDDSGEVPEDGDNGEGNDNGGPGNNNGNSGKGNSGKGKGNGG
jgi:hypothetical protein